MLKRNRRSPVYQCQAERRAIDLSLWISLKDLVAVVSKDDA